MKVLLYFEKAKAISTSGIGRAMKHQILALQSANIEYTINPFDDYDILHINTYFLNSEAMINKARKERKPVIYHAHSTEEDFKNSFIFSNQFSPFYKKHLVNLYTKADEIITPTPYSKKILESYDIKLPINVVSNGIDLSKYQYDFNKIKAFRKYFNLKENDKVIISVGLLFERKGILDFFEVAKKLPDYKFIWFGTTPSISLPKNIKDAIDKRSDNVIMPGYVKGPIIEGAYLGSDCFFFPSLEETEGIVVLEALASKQKVIVRNIDVFKPWLIHQENALIANNNEEFIKYIEMAVNNKMDDMCLKAFETAKKRSIENIGLELKKIYTRVYKNINNQNEEKK